MRTSPSNTIRQFKVGTLGWTAADLDDPKVEREWNAGRYEIVDGVLTEMPPAYFAHGSVLLHLIFVLRNYFENTGMDGRWAAETDIVIESDRVAVADAVFLTIEDLQRQKQAEHRLRRIDRVRSRIYVPPTLVIESVSPGHGRHDRKTKQRWYAEFGVPHYWIVDAPEQRLDCLLLDGTAYRLDAGGKQSDAVNPTAFPGLHISLQSLWLD